MTPFHKFLEEQGFQADACESLEHPDFYRLAESLWNENTRLRNSLGLEHRVIPDSGGHIESPDCWCGPTVEKHPGGQLIIHNQTH